jgi:hypothetical protein
MFPKPLLQFTGLAVTLVYSTLAKTEYQMYSGTGCTGALLATKNGEPIGTCRWVVFSLLFEGCATN